MGTPAWFSFLMCWIKTDAFMRGTWTKPQTTALDTQQVSEEPHRPGLQPIHLGHMGPVRGTLESTPQPPPPPPDTSHLLLDTFARRFPFNVSVLNKDGPLSTQPFLRGPLPWPRRPAGPALPVLKVGVEVTWDPSHTCPGKEKGGHLPASLVLASAPAAHCSRAPQVRPWGQGTKKLYWG